MVRRASKSVFWINACPSEANWSARLCWKGSGSPRVCAPTGLGCYLCHTWEGGAALGRGEEGAERLLESPTLPQWAH